MSRKLQYIFKYFFTKSGVINKSQKVISVVEE